MKSVENEMTQLTKRTKRKKRGKMPKTLAASQDWSLERLKKEGKTKSDQT
jgi:hypothetical protein